MRSHFLSDSLRENRVLVLSYHPGLIGWKLFDGGLGRALWLTDSNAIDLHVGLLEGILPNVEGVTREVSHGLVEHRSTFVLGSWEAKISEQNECNTQPKGSNHPAKNSSERIVDLDVHLAEAIGEHAKNRGNDDVHNHKGSDKTQECDHLCLHLHIEIIEIETLGEVAQVEGSDDGNQDGHDPIAHREKPFGGPPIHSKNDHTGENEVEWIEHKCIVHDAMRKSLIRRVVVSQSLR